MFIDRAKIIVTSGAGGDGMVSFRREKYVPRGGPSGGDGGKGGSVIVVANPDLNTLVNIRRHRHFTANKGENGGAKEMFGKNAEDVIVEVAEEATLILQQVLSVPLHLLKKGNQESRKKSDWNLRF